MGDLKVKEALLHLGGSVSLYRTLLQGFKDKYSFVDQDIKKNLLYGHMDSGRLLAHKMKGLSGNLGANEFQKKAMNLERVMNDYKNKDILDVDIDLILAKEWLEFSEELNLLNRCINLVLDADDKHLLSIDTTRQLINS